MTPEQTKKYEEAAKEYAANAIGDEESMIPETRIYYDACIEDFLAGCTLASQELDVEMQELVDETHHLGEQLIIEKEHNKRLIESLSDCLTLLTECSYDATEVTEKARKLLNQ